jgi:hypothetical protein
MIAASVLVVGLPVRADTLITMMEGGGQAAAEDSGDEIRVGKPVRIWSRPNNMARVQDGGRMIFSIDRGMTFMVDDNKKTCRAFRHPQGDPSAADESEAFEIRKTGDDRRVGDWDAEGYAMTVPMQGSEATLEVAFWVSEQLTDGLDTYRANFAAMTTPQTAWMRKTLELGGYPVLQESRFGQMMMWSQVLSVEEQAPPEGIYDVPAGYTGCTAD